MSSLSPHSKKIRMKNVRQSTWNLKKSVDKYRKKCSIKLRDDQVDDLEQLIDCIEQSSTGREELKKVFREAENKKTGDGTKLKMIWEEDKKLSSKTKLRVSSLMQSLQRSLFFNNLLADVTR